MNKKRTWAAIKPGALSTLISIICLCVCIYFLVTFLFLVFSNYWPGPYKDYWIDIFLVEKYYHNELTFLDLVKTHYGSHILLIPRLLFIADFRLFGGSNLLIVLTCLLCKAFTILLLNYLISGQTRINRLLLNIVIFASILNANNLYNILYSFDVQWDLMLVFALLAIYFYYTGSFENKSKPSLFFGMAYLCFFCGWFSQAGALPILLIFLLMSIQAKNYQLSIFNLLLLAAALYVNFGLLPNSDPSLVYPIDLSTASSLASKLIGTINFTIQLMADGLQEHIANYSLIFSMGVISITLVAFYCNKQASASTNKLNILFYIALYCLLTITSIGLARVNGIDASWITKRYQTIPLVYISTITLFVFLRCSSGLATQYGKLQKISIITFTLTFLFLVQYFTFSFSFIKANEAFHAQTKLFTYGRSADNSWGLRFALNQDSAALIDPFFKSNDFAYYANKQAKNSAYKELVEVGHPLLSADDVSALSPTCDHIKGVMEGETLWFLPSPKLSYFQFLKNSLNRNTYYALNEQGVVAGFAFFLIGEDHHIGESGIMGVGSARNSKYIVEIKNGVPRCLFDMEITSTK